MHCSKRTTTQIVSVGDGLIAVVDATARLLQRQNLPVEALMYRSANCRYRFSGTRTPSRSSICVRPKRRLCFPAAVSLRPISSPNTSPCSLRRSDCRPRMEPARSFRPRPSPAHSARRPRCRSERPGSPRGNSRSRWPNGFARHINQLHRHPVTARTDAVQKFVWDRPWRQ
jgi:hypothetical protein